jgi:uridine phosphorylase
MGVLNYEMETATLMTMCASSGLRAGCIAGVLVNRVQQETPSEGRIQATESRAIDAVVAAARTLLAHPEG